MAPASRAAARPARATPRAAARAAVGNAGAAATRGRAELVAEAEVDDLERGAGVEAQVLGLDVTVADLLAVAVLDAIEQLVEVGARDDVIHAVAQ